MGFLIKAIASLFSGKANSDLTTKIPEDNLPIYNGKIEVDKYVMIEENRVKGQKNICSKHRMKY